MREGIGGGEERKCVGVGVRFGVRFSALLEAGTWISGECVRAGVTVSRAVEGSTVGVASRSGSGSGRGADLRRVVRGGGAVAAGAVAAGAFLERVVVRVVGLLGGAGSSDVGVRSVWGWSLAPDRVALDLVVVVVVVVVAVAGLVGFLVAVDDFPVAPGTEGGLTVRIGRGIASMSHSIICGVCMYVSVPVLMEVKISGGGGREIDEIAVPA